jgi:cytochrome c-type biogenesis protein CcmH
MPELPMTDTVASLKQQLLHAQQLHESGALDAQAYAQTRATLERKLLDQVLASPAAEAEAGDQSGRASKPGNAGKATSARAAGVAGAAGAASAGLPAGAARPRRSTVLAAAAFVTIVGVAGYLLTGSPSLIGETAAAAGPDGGASAPHGMGDQIAGLVKRLEDRLKDKPDDAEGWAMLGRSYAVLGRMQEALPAYEKAIQLVGENAALLADYADVLALANNRSLEGEPMKVVERALKADPRQLKALSLAGTHAFDKKDYAGAVKYWERLMAAAPGNPDAPRDPRFLDQVQASIDEARQLGGMPPSPNKGKSFAQAAPAQQPPMMGGGAAAGGGGGEAAPAAPNPNAFVSGKVTLAAAVAAKASPEDTVFVFARAAEGPRMPLAIVRKQVKDLPIDFKLDDSMAMQPQMRLSAFPKVVVGARVSKKGDAVPQPGDLEGLSAPVAVGTAGLKIEISQVVGAK